MKLIKPWVAFEGHTYHPLEAIEHAGRTCYKSEEKITDDSAEKFVKNIITKKHEAMIEFADMAYRVICDRGVTHEIVRHRLFSYAQESTRYCNYKGGVTFIIPPWIRIPECYIAKEVELKDNGLCIPPVEFKESCHFPLAVENWLIAVSFSEKAYKDLLSCKWTPQQARSVLPNSLKTEIVIKGNLREWRHFFKLRCTPIDVSYIQKVNGIYYGANAPHPQMQEVANMVLKDASMRIPIIFDEFKK